MLFDSLGGSASAGRFCSRPSKAVLMGPALPSELQKRSSASMFVRFAECYSRPAARSYRVRLCSRRCWADFVGGFRRGIARKVGSCRCGLVKRLRGGAQEGAGLDGGRSRTMQ